MNLSSPRRIFWLLFTLNLFNYVDRQVLFSVFPLLERDLGLSDTQLGFLGSAFMIVYMFYAPFAGYFADRTSRPGWMGISAFLWSIATMASALVGSFKQLLFTRSFIGIGEAGFTSIAQGYLADITTPEKRARILAAFGLAMPVGGALGYLFGGFIGEHFGWRIAFLLVGVPGAVLAMLVFFLRDASRQSIFKKEKPSVLNYFYLLKNLKYLYICLGQAMATFVVGGLSAWMPTYIHRTFDLDVAQAGFTFGLLVIVAGAIGTFLGGQTADRLLAKTKKAYLFTAGGSFVLSFPFAVAGFISNNFIFAMSMFFVAVIFAFSQTGPLAAAIVDTTDSRVRSMAFALNIFIIHALGDAISPVMIGLMSDFFTLKVALLLCFCAFAPALMFVGLALKEE